MLILHTFSSVYRDVVSQMGLEYILSFPVRLLKSEKNQLLKIVFLVQHCSKHCTSEML